MTSDEEVTANPAQFASCSGDGQTMSYLQQNLWITALRNKDISVKKGHLTGPKLLFSVQIAPWNEDTSELGTLLVRP
jgi:hypothetical protein